MVAKLFPGRSSRGSGSPVFREITFWPEINEDTTIVLNKSGAQNPCGCHRAKNRGFYPAHSLIRLSWTQSSGNLLTESELIDIFRRLVWCSGEFSVCGWTGGLACATLEVVVPELYRGLFCCSKSVVLRPFANATAPPCTLHGLCGREQRNGIGLPLCCSRAGDESSVTVDCVFV